MFSILLTVCLCIRDQTVVYKWAFRFKFSIKRMVFIGVFNSKFFFVVAVIIVGQYLFFCSAVANWFIAPETISLLEAIKPQHLLLRVMTRALILWDKIVPSTEWVTNG